jgi:autotransporter strand-loop-strand O-heptosyltransferase
MPTSLEMQQQLIQMYENTKISNTEHVREIKDSFGINFINGARVEILGHSKNMYRVQFIDADTNYIVYETSISTNNWSKPSRVWYTNWKIKIFNELTGELMIEETFNLAGRRAYIALDSKSLGDTLAWFPYVNEFRKKHNCQVVCSTFWNDLFKKTYPDISFINPGDVAENLYAMYTVGIFDSANKDQHINDTRTIPLQQVCSDFLGLDYREIIPDIYIKNRNRPVFGRYACLATESTAQAKYWNRPNGWQEIVDYLNILNIKPMVIHKGATDLKGVEDKTGDIDIQERLAQLYNCEFFIGIGSGMSWLAWAMRKPVIMISGFSKPFCEFETNCKRVINESVCNGCFNDSSFIFDKGDWNWCPRLKGTNRQFECTKEITFDMVKKQIDSILEPAIQNKFYTHERPNENLYLPSTIKPNIHWKEQEIKSVLPYHEIFEDKEYEYGGCIIEPDDIVLDIGAHIGIFTRYAATRWASKIIAVEPGIDNFELWKKNKPSDFFFKESDCIGYQVAITNANEERDLSFDSHHIHSFYDQSNTHTGEKYKVKCITLDSLIAMEKLEKIDFIKLDIEGSEVEALEGISDENLMKIRKFCMEYHHVAYNYNEKMKQSVIDRFARLGFKYYIRGFVNTNDVYIMHFWK